MLIKLIYVTMSKIKLRFEIIYLIWKVSSYPNLLLLDIFTKIIKPH